MLKESINDDSRKSQNSSNEEIEELHEMISNLKANLNEHINRAEALIFQRAEAQDELEKVQKRVVDLENKHGSKIMFLNTKIKQGFGRYLEKRKIIS